MKAIKVLIVILIVVVAAIAVRNKVLLDKSIKNYNQRTEDLKTTRHATNEVQKAVIQSNTASMMHLGKTLQMTGIEKIFPGDQWDKQLAKQPRLLLVFSELSCNVCQDAETRFGVSIASDYGKESVMAVVHATNRRYVSNYIRLNQVNFTVYFDENETFLKQNSIKNTPMIFVIDSDNKVISANYPIPGHLEYSEPMHKFCYHYFNKFSQE